MRVRKCLECKFFLDAGSIETRTWMLSYASSCLRTSINPSLELLMISKGKSSCNDQVAREIILEIFFWRLLKFYYGHHPTLISLAHLGPSPDLIYFQGCCRPTWPPSSLMRTSTNRHMWLFLSFLGFQPLCIFAAAYGHLLIQVSSKSSVRRNFFCDYIVAYGFLLFLVQTYA